jgi:hypothetical protein
MAQGLPHGREPRERGGRVVFHNLSEQIRECLQHAEDYALKAAGQTDPNLSGAAISHRLANGSRHD